MRVFLFTASDTGAELCPQDVSEPGRRTSGCPWHSAAGREAQEVNAEGQKQAQPVESGILGSRGANPSGSDPCRGGQGFPGSAGAETPREPKPGAGGSDSHGIPWE